VPVYSCSGFDSLTAKHELAREAHDAFTYEGKQTVVLHLGDLDPSGVSIYESMREDVLSFVSTDVPHMDPEDVIFFERVALERWHIGAHGLTTYPPKASDKRSRRWEGPTCQLEALPPDTLARELAGAIQMFLDPDALAKAREDEVTYYRQVNRALTGAG
jgi:hypothetical protein